MTNMGHRMGAALDAPIEASIAASDRVEGALRAVTWLDGSPEAREHRAAVDASDRARAAYLAAKAA